MADYTISRARATRPTSWPTIEGFGEMRSYTGPLEAEQVAFTWRQMPPGTGGRGSYGHRHLTQEEIYFVTSGDGHVQGRRRRLRGRPGTAVRIAPEPLRSIHNDTDEEAEMVLCSVRVDDLRGEVETEDGFWPRSRAPRTAGAGAIRRGRDGCFIL